jgi:oxalate decarboxylase/phosphoglucose isomerase-like protein (cupin superfamily)
MSLNMDDADAVLGKSSPSKISPFSKQEIRIIVDNKTYKIQDLNFYNGKGRVAFTISTTVLRARQQTRGHAHNDSSEVYEFLQGSGVMVVDKMKRNVTPGDFVFVDNSVFHKVINTSDSFDMVFRCYFNGESKRPQIK